MRRSVAACAALVMLSGCGHAAEAAEQPPKDRKVRLEVIAPAEVHSAVVYGVGTDATDKTVKGTWSTEVTVSGPPTRAMLVAEPDHLMQGERISCRIIVDGAPTWNDTAGGGLYRTSVCHGIV